MPWQKPCKCSLAVAANSLASEGSKCLRLEDTLASTGQQGVPLVGQWKRGRRQIDDGAKEGGYRMSQYQFQLPRVNSFVCFSQLSVTRLTFSEALGMSG